MKILFVNPPPRSRDYSSIVVPPLGLLYVATRLKSTGFDVTLKDAFAERTTWSDFQNYVRTERPDVLGIGGTTPIIDTSFRAVRAARPHVRHIIMGGPHVSLYGQELFNQCPDIDFGVVGEGEETALELVRALDQQTSLHGIAGIVTKESRNPQRGLIRDVDSIESPDRALVPNQRYHYPFLRYRRVTTMFTSRGCPYRCAFCDKSTFGSTWRPRSVPNVLREIDEVVDRFHTRSIIFYDDLFTLKKERVMELCEGILNRGYKLDWKCEGRVNLVDLEMLKLMKRAGCSMMAFGVESANQAGLDYLNKKTRVEEIRRAFELTRQAGIKTIAYFILGIPVETYEDELHTIEFAKEIRPTYAQFSVLSPFYGTKAHEDAVKNGWYREIDAQNPEDQDRRRPVMISPNWTEDRLRRILKAAHRMFYFRPSYILGQIRSIRSVHEVSSRLSAFLNMVQWLRK